MDLSHYCLFPTYHVSFVLTPKYESKSTGVQDGMGARSRGGANYSGIDISLLFSRLDALLLIFFLYLLDIIYHRPGACVIRC